MPINVVKELMGHSSIATTEEFYSKVDEDQLAKVQWVGEAVTLGGKRRATDA